MAKPDPNLRLVVVFESADPVAIGIATSALEDAGIEFGVIEEALTGYGFSPILNPVRRIQVAEPDEARAREALESVARSVEAEPDGEEVEEAEGDEEGS